MHKKAVIGTFMTMFIAIWVIVLLLAGFIALSSILKISSQNRAGTTYIKEYSGVNTYISDFARLVTGKFYALTKNEKIGAALDEAGYHR